MNDKQALDHELAVVGCCILYPSTAQDICSMLVEADFADRDCRKAFNACEAALIAGVPEALWFDEVANRIDNDLWIASTQSKASRNWLWPAKQIKLRSASRTASKTLRGRSDNALNAKAELDLVEQLDASISDCLKIKEAYLTAIGDKSRDPIGDAFDQAIQRSLHPNSGMRTGIERIDSTIGGMYDSDLILIAGRPSQGKTDLALNVCYNMAMEGHHVLFLSLEMSSESVWQRILSLSCGVYRGKWRTGASAEEIELGRSHLPALRALPLHIESPSGASMDEIRSIVADYKAKHELKLVVIDYIGLIRPAKAHSREQEVASISRGLKGLSKEFKLPLIALSQLNRMMERDERAPQLQDLRDSGSLEQDADIVMMIHWQTIDDDGSKYKRWGVLVRKNRSGACEDIYDIDYDKGAGWIGRGNAAPLYLSRDELEPVPQTKVDTQEVPF